jgi:prepilin-type N-terminal cleavage/methylation domain-containing protein
MRTPTPSPRRSAGFSLIELLLVLGLLGVLLTLAAPSLEAFHARQKARRALDRVAADVAHARLLAVRSGSRTVLRTGAAGRYTIGTISDAGDTAVVKTVDLMRDFPGASFANPALRLHFSSRGLVTNSTDGQAVTIVTRVGRDSLLVNPAGRVFRGR